MPDRYGYATTPLQAGLHGAFENAGQSVALWTQEQRQVRQQQRAAQIAMVKDLADKVMAGADPDQAYAAATSFGARVPPQFFHNLQPSAENRLKSAMGPVNAATSAETFPTEPAVNTNLAAAHLNPIAGESNAAPFIQPGSFEETNAPAAAQYGAKRQALTNAIEPKVIGKTAEAVPPYSPNAVPPVEGWMPPEGPTDFQPTEIKGRYNPFSGKEEETSRSAVGPSALTAGMAAGAQQVAEAPGKGAAESEVERITRPGMVARAQETAGATERGRVLASAEPEVLAAATKVRYATELAAERARIAGQREGFTIDPGLITTSIGNKYVDLEKFEGMDKRFAARMASEAGLTAVTGPQSALLRDIDGARQKLQNLALLSSHLSPESWATLRGLKGANEITINRKLQTDPALAQFAAAAVDGIGIMRAVGGPQGFRSNRIEFEQTLQAITPFQNTFLADSAPFYLQKLNYLLRSLLYNELVNVQNNRQTALQR